MLRIDGQVQHVRQADVAVRRGKRHIAHDGGPDGDVGLGAAEIAGDRVKRDEYAGEFDDRVRNVPQSAEHRPLPEQQSRQLAGGEGGGVWNLEPLHRPRRAGLGIDDRRAVQRLAGVRVHDGIESENSPASS